jgi:hypothetical protein
MGASADRIAGEYASLLSARADCVREERQPLREEAVQSLWYTQQGLPKRFKTDQGQRLKILSPGWWNRGEGPDFLGAQLEFNGRLKTGDVEVHLRHQDWNLHGHDRDPRYNDVLLHVVLDTDQPRDPVRTAAGRAVPALLLPNFLKHGLDQLTRNMHEQPRITLPPQGRCAAWTEKGGGDALRQILELAGEWRLMFKARLLSERMHQVGLEQPVYERLLEACGYGPYKHEFLALARHVPYERARQLAQEDAHLLEAAYLHVAGLLPHAMTDNAPGKRHWERLQHLRHTHLSGLRTVAMAWNRSGVRPTNFPERRLSGVARFVARTAPAGLLDSLDQVWMEGGTPTQRRRAFERLFPCALGFWANHCTWGGKALSSPNAPIGAGRIRSIVGNVFVPAALAAARETRDRQREALVLAFFARLPQEPDNHITRRMLPRLFGAAKPPRMTFRIQQGLHQMFVDWCEPNPACHNCAVIRRLEQMPPQD